MSAWVIGAVIGASLGMLRVARQPALARGVPLDDPADWRHALHQSLRLLRVWLVLGPVCFLAAFALLQGVGPATAGIRHAAEVLGLLPVVGLFGSTALAMLRIGDARRRADDVLHQALGWSLVLGGGTLAGVLASGVARFLAPHV